MTTQTSEIGALAPSATASEPAIAPERRNHAARQPWRADRAIDTEGRNEIAEQLDLADAVYCSLRNEIDQADVDVPPPDLVAAMESLKVAIGDLQTARSQGARKAPAGACKRIEDSLALLISAGGELRAERAEEEHHAHAHAEASAHVSKPKPKPKPKAKPVLHIKPCSLKPKIAKPKPKLHLEPEHGHTLPIVVAHGRLPSIDGMNLNDGEENTIRRLNDAIAHARNDREREEAQRREEAALKAFVRQRFGVVADQVAPILGDLQRHGAQLDLNHRNGVSLFEACLGLERHGIRELRDVTGDGHEDERDVVQMWNQINAERHRQPPTPAPAAIPSLRPTIA